MTQQKTTSLKKRRGTWLDRAVLTELPCLGNTGESLAGMDPHSDQKICTRIENFFRRVSPNAQRQLELAYGMHGGPGLARRDLIRLARSARKGKFFAFCFSENGHKHSLPWVCANIQKTAYQAQLWRLIRDLWNELDRPNAKMRAINRTADTI